MKGCLITLLLGAFVLIFLALLLGTPIYFLWNWFITKFHVEEITYFQACMAGLCVAILPAIKVSSNVEIK